MKRKKPYEKTMWLYLDGKKHCDVLKWALAARMTLKEAKEYFLNFYKNDFGMSIEFKVE